MAIEWKTIAFVEDVISDTAYGTSWDGVTDVAPSKNAVYDELIARPRCNIIINGNFSVNQRVFDSGGTLAEGIYGHDRWKAGSGGCNYTFAISEGKVTITIPSSKTLLQVIEGTFLQSGTYTLSWEGTAQGKIGAGSFAASPITASVTGGSNLTITFNAGTVANVQLEKGSTATEFEYRPFAEELALCQRYYQKSYNTNVAPGTVTEDGNVEDMSTGIYLFIDRPLKCSMRYAPTVVLYNSATGATGTWRDSTLANKAVAGIGAMNNIIFISAVLTANAIISGHYTAEAEL
jgi:hypothetical protein